MTTRTPAARTRRLLLVAMAGFLTAAYAAAGSFPLEGARRQLELARASASVVDLDGPVTRAGEASVLFDAPGLTPGAVRIAQIRIQNSGATKGAFSFSHSQLADAPTGLREPLSAVLDLVMQDATNRFRPITLYTGKLGAIGPIALGDLQPGEARTYRFVVSYPSGRTPEQDNPLQGATSSIVFDWDALFDGAPPPPAADRRPGATAPSAVNRRASRGHRRPARQKQRRELRKARR